jgi:hypothetical protein
MGYEQPKATPRLPLRSMKVSSKLQVMQIKQMVHHFLLNVSVLMTTFQSFKSTSAGKMLLRAKLSALTYRSVEQVVD